MSGWTGPLPSWDWRSSQEDGRSIMLRTLSAQSRGSGASGGGAGKREVPGHCYDEKETVEAELPQAWLAGSSFSLMHAPARCCGPLPFEVSTPP